MIDLVYRSLIGFSIFPNPFTVEDCISDESPTDEQRKFSKTWAMLIKKIWGADPLECPKCKSRMKVIDFITDDYVIEKSLKDLGIQSLYIDTAERGPPLSMAGFEDLFL